MGIIVTQSGDQCSTVTRSKAQGEGAGLFKIGIYMLFITKRDLIH